MIIASNIINIHSRLYEIAFGRSIFYWIPCNFIYNICNRLLLNLRQRTINNPVNFMRANIPHYHF